MAAVGSGSGALLFETSRANPAGVGKSKEASVTAPIPT